MTINQIADRTNPWHSNTMILKLIRQVLGWSIVGLNALFPPKRLKRPLENQLVIDEKTTHLALYQFKLCPFCVRVRRMMTRLNLTIKTHDIQKSPDHHNELVAGGGKRKVPCLRIQQGSQVTWLYESLAINDYLKTQFGRSETV